MRVARFLGSRTFLTSLRGAFGRRCCSTDNNAPTRSVLHVQRPQLARDLEPFVPTVFSTLTTIESRLPRELAEKVASCGGLASVLDCECEASKIYVVSKLGRVVVARKKMREQETVADAAPTGSGAALSCAATERPPWAVDNLFPRFAVPLSALMEARCSMMPSLAATAVQRQTHIDCETVRKEVAAQGASAHLEVVEGVLLDTRYLRPKRAAAQLWTSTLSNALSSALRESSSTDSDLIMQLEGGGDDSREVVSDLERRLLEFFVEPYERYRVARSLSCVTQPLTDSRIAACLQSIGGSGESGLRRLDLILVSAPHLFEVAPRGGDQSHQHIAALKYFLPSSCDDLRSAMFRKEQGAELQMKIDRHLKARFPNRVRIRRLQRLYVAATCPTPFLDPDVFAHALFDALPLSGEPMEFEVALQKSMSYEESRCRPVDLRAFLDSYPHLFTVTQMKRGSNVLSLVRADSSLIPVLREQEEAAVPDEEVVSCIFELYPRRLNPSLGIALDQVRKILPHRVRQAIKTRGIVNILTSQPDKVEVLQPRRASSLARFSGSDGDVCFRFVGALHDSLQKTYNEAQGQHSSRTRTDA